MKTFLLFPLCFAFLAVCLGGSFEVTGSLDADAAGFQLDFPYVPDHSQMLPADFPNITDYYLHIEYDANIINPVGIFVTQVQDQPAINGLNDPIPGQPYLTNDNVFGQTSNGEPTVTPIVADPDIECTIAPPSNSVQGTQITLIITLENFGTRRPVDPSIDFTLPGDFVDLLGATANRPNVTINITEVNGDYQFHITWAGGSLDGAASDVSITIDLFLHSAACDEFAALNARTEMLRGLTPSNSSSGNSTGNSTSSSLNCPPAGTPDFGDFDPACRPQPTCPTDLESLLPTGACGAFCLQGVVYPNYDSILTRLRINMVRNFVDVLTDDPTQPGSADPTIVFFFAFIPDSSSNNVVTDDSSSTDLVVILLPLFLGLLCLCCLAILLAALLAALWWFLTGREKMRTRVQWIPGRNKGGDDDGL